MPNDKPALRAYQPLLPENLAEAGQAANEIAARYRFEDYRQRHAIQTVRRQVADLALFVEFLNTLGVKVGALSQEPAAWSGITWGLVESFVKWQLREGYALPSVNVRLSTIKTYSRLAFQAGTLPAQEYALIRAVQGYGRHQQPRVESRRSVHRVGLKKETPVHISPEQARALKNQPPTPQGCRDGLLLCLLLDHGLRAGEAAGLGVDQVDLEEGTLRFYRPKVAKEQTHRLTQDTLAALHAYAACGGLEPGKPLLRRILKNEQFGQHSMTTRGISLRVELLGDLLGLEHLSAHDCRHFWATSAARHGTDPFVLQEAGGWSSLAMPRRYVEEQAVANLGVKLENGDEDSREPDPAG
ncbi:MAG TPA: site-specific integrase [Longilinea sp.]|nr:site-specific integrase [Longilinea sp.]